MADQGDPSNPFGDIASALALLTRFPMPGHVRPRGAKAAWAWPVAGLATGLAAVLTGGLAQALQLPDPLVAAAILATAILATGALHEDGLADVADGFWGGSERARRLEIMKDSRIGSYGVIALVLSLLVRWAALDALVAAGDWGWAVMAAAVMSRAPMAALSWMLPHARSDGLSHRVGRASGGNAVAAMALAGLVGLAATGWAALPALLAAGLALAGCAALARAKIGGQTGDVLGAAQQICEIALLGTFAAIL